MAESDNPCFPGIVHYLRRDTHASCFQLTLCVCVTSHPTRGCVGPACRVKVRLLESGDSAHTAVHNIRCTVRGTEWQCLGSKQSGQAAQISPPSVWGKEGLNMGFPVARQQGSNTSSFPLVPALDQKRNYTQLHPQQLSSGAQIITSPTSCTRECTQGKCEWKKSKTKWQTGSKNGWSVFPVTLVSKVSRVWSLD